MIGEGGMGQVWLVWDLELEIKVAIKILNPQLTSNPDSVKLLKNECRNTRRLVHPNIVRVFDFHRFEDLAFILHGIYRRSGPEHLPQPIRTHQPGRNYQACKARDPCIGLCP